jgi:hypothetical protein
MSEELPVFFPRQDPERGGNKNSVLGKDWAHLDPALP